MFCLDGTAPCAGLVRPTGPGTKHRKPGQSRSLPDLQKPARPSMARESFGLVLAGDEFHPATAATAKGKLTLHPSAEVVSSVGTPHGRATRDGMSSAVSERSFTSSKRC